jgi:hypothetical protein
MPFKGDMRLGGRHSNVASLNGTASDFGVPAYGTVLSGPTDTSRNEPDYGGFMFYMPYSTTVYADGLGGQTSTETWGLQYLPAGWRTGTGNQQILITISSANLPSNIDVPVGDQDFYFQEDGTGINYIGEATSNNYLYSGAQIYGNGDYIWYSNGIGGYYEEYSPSNNNPPYGTYAGSGSGNLYFTTPTCGDYVVGSYSYVNYHDGNGGTYSQGSDDYLTYNTELGTCGDYTYYSAGQASYPWEGDYYSAFWHYYNGYGLGYSVSYTQNNNWVIGAAGGQYLQYETRTNLVADGHGNSNTVYPSYNWYLPYGDVIGNGSYDDPYYDDNGDWQQNTIYFTVYADGMGNYYSQNN